ncbi:sensor histidine kinase [Georgenia sunbinii]|uniref:sensor histidine kinase n=1 Tax=Georgenia sunbinii TaxID=3117728 RepID=UPI002F26A564
MPSLPPGDLPSGGLPPLTEPITALSARRLGPVRRFFHRHPAVMDVVVACWYLLPAIATIIWSVAGQGNPLAAVVLALVAGGALLRRRHEPVLVLGLVTAALLVALLVLGDAVGIEIASVLALYAVAAFRRPAVAWGSLVVVNLLYVAGYAQWATNHGQTVVTTGPDTDAIELTATQALLVTGSTQLALSVIALALGAAARGRRLHVASLVERTAQLALERDQREQIALVAERNRIAREMHDVVAHSLSVMVALSDGAAAALDRRPEQAREALAELSAAGRSALADTRRVLGVLREEPDGSGAAPLSPQPTAAPSLGDLVAQFQAAGLPVTFEESGPPLPHDAGLQLAVYRVVQESLTNALRHAPGAPRIAVTIERWQGRVVIEVDNDDGGPAPVSADGRGLVGMRERAAVYDGHVDAGPTSTGWRVRALLRWTEEDE